MDIAIPTISSKTNLFECAIEGRKLDVYEFSMTERLSEDFILSMTVVSKFRLKIHDYLEKRALLTLKGSKVDRYFHGRIHSFTEMKSAGRYYMYHGVALPNLTYLGNLQDVRVFQNMTPREIIEEVLKGIGMHSNTYEFRLKSTYSPREYCVQYRETSHSFLHRIMAEEGITHYHEHTKEGHLLVFADSFSSHIPITGKTSVLYSEKGQLTIDEECVTDISRTDRVTSGRVQLRDYDLNCPSSFPEAKTNDKEYDSQEIYDYPGRFIDDQTGHRLAKVALERRTSNRLTLTGSSQCRHFSVGRRFDLMKHPEGDFNGLYMLTEVIHTGKQPQTLQELTGSGGGGTTYGNTFICIPKNVVWRPDPPGPKPSVTGVQSAVVTGPKDEEIYTDDMGRIKVQFNWDRLGKKDDRSSCWIRVAQPWAGAGWGHVFTPRIGQEVIVSFIDGDPDRPVVTGTVYNGANMPPYPFPRYKTRSTIMTRSTKGGDGFNELRFEDLKNEEEIYIHAQKDWNTDVLNDKSQTIGHDDALDVGNNRSESVGVNKFITVGANHTEAIGANMNLTVGGIKNETVTLASTENVGAAKALNVGGAYTVTVIGGMNTAVGLGQFEEVGLTKQVRVGKSLEISVNDTVTLTCGKSRITMDNKGTITINGAKLAMNGSDHVEINGEVVDIN